MIPSQDLESRVKELKVSESALQANSTRIEELAAKLDGAETMNRTLLTEMAALQTEKTTFETKVANSVKEEQVLKDLLSQKEVTHKKHCLQVSWHFLRESARCLEVK